MRIRNGLSAPTKGAVPTAEQQKVEALREMTSNTRIIPALYAPGVNLTVEARTFVRELQPSRELQADVVLTVRTSTMHRQSKSLSLKSALLLLAASGADQTAEKLEKAGEELALEVSGWLEGMSDDDLRPLLRVKK